MTRTTEIDTALTRNADYARQDGTYNVGSYFICHLHQSLTWGFAI